jgi:hypothetical protein
VAGAKGYEVHPYLWSQRRVRGTMNFVPLLGPQQLGRLDFAYEKERGGTVLVTELSRRYLRLVPMQPCNGPFLSSLRRTFVIRRMLPTLAPARRYIEEYGVRPAYLGSLMLMSWRFEQPCYCHYVERSTASRNIHQYRRPTRPIPAVITLPQPAAGRSYRSNECVANDRTRSAS